MDVEALEKEIAVFRPDLLIAAVSTQTIESDLILLRKIKTKHNTFIAAFGVHATVFAEEILSGHTASGPSLISSGQGKAAASQHLTAAAKGISEFSSADFTGIDAVIRGEPEETAAELADALDAALSSHSSGRIKPHSPTGTLLGNVKGLSFRNHGGKVQHNPDRPFIQDLDALPFPAWEHVDLSNYTLPLYERPYVIVNTVRGCPFRCSFCTTQTYYGAKARLRSVESILHEVRHIKSKFDIDDVFFWGDTFTLDKTQITELCQGLITEKSSLRWVANSRVDTVDRDILALMKLAGCWMLSYGIESGDEALLKGCGKNISIGRIRETVRATRDSGIMASGHFILGLPGETEETARKTLKLARSLKLDFVNVYAAVPYPGSPLYNEALSRGWLPEDRRWMDFHQANFVMDLPTVSGKFLEKQRKKAYYRNYLNPRTAKKVLSGSSLRSVFRNIGKSLGYLLRIGWRRGG
jgi:anaerobic magnesium-protoporphyrin IX monomethyl ester cyclase